MEKSRDYEYQLTRETAMSYFSGEGISGDFKIPEPPRNNGTLVICGVPGVGKTHLSTMAQNFGLSISDSDSSKFSLISKGVRNPDFPLNYVKHIVSLLGKVDIICASTHAEVRSELTRHGVEFYIAMPKKGQKNEYMRRLRSRPLKPQETQNERDEFVALMETVWEKWIEQELPNEPCQKRLWLKEDEYLGHRTPRQPLSTNSEPSRSHSGHPMHSEDSEVL